MFNTKNEWQIILLGIYIFLASVLYSLSSGFHGLLSLFFLATNCLHIWALLGFLCSWKVTLYFLSHFCWRIHKKVYYTVLAIWRWTHSLIIFFITSFHKTFQKYVWQEVLTNMFNMVAEPIFNACPWDIVPAKLLMFQLYHCHISEVLTKGNYVGTCVCNLWLKNSPFTITLPRASLNVNTSIKRTVIKKNLTMTSCNNDIAAICLTGANQSLNQKICAFLGQHSWYTTIPFFKIWTDYLLMI